MATSLSFTYNQLIAYLQTTLEDASVEYVANLQTMVALGESRLATFRESLESGFARLLDSAHFDHNEIQVLENTPDEIAAAAAEMEERLRGTWQTTDEDEELQNRFWSLFDPGELYGHVPTRIGAEFLRKNRKLLD